ncbi:hypothetical protein I8748_23590 [Nostoc sp. CENA67]|uniref:Uncharacterized protein n=1 Tax=Amazonocrinis nigriterrae CENA67 TaxID=2794033 RepID=A0A8J7L936_9NOST|nr:hypothetical protein [Amazonocrinis nigriterrae]MBH8565129.1 hypothetical protein [Amazonocrinis nigriterrae CENA67]
MANIIISELNLVDSETYLTEINKIDSMLVYGGDNYAFSQFISFTLKLLKFVVAIYAIHSITLLAKSFNTNDTNAYLPPFTPFISNY